MVPAPGLRAAQPEETRNVAEVRALRATEPIRLDGRLDDVAWTHAEAADTFEQRDPDEGKPATERTELRVAYDDDALYVGVRLYDTEPKAIVRQLSRRDDQPDADRFTLYLDPHHDHLTGAQFGVSAAGVQSDAVIYNDSWTDSSWDAVWESAVSQDEQGWTLEMKIPFSQLRFPAGENHVFGINAGRVIQRRNETAFLEMVPKKESGLASRMAHLTGLDGIQPRRALSLLPYTVARAEFVEPATGDPFNDGSRAFGGMGLDAKWGLSSNLTADLTLNPDFGQVEVDPAVVNLSDFETFYEEKRPFFIEGSQIFSNFGRNGANNFWGFNRSEPDLFYSRRIGRSPQGDASGDYVDAPTTTTILGAAKLTGKTASGWSVGVLDALTAAESARTSSGGVSGSEQVEPLTNYFVGRAHRDLARGGFGVLGTVVFRDLGSPALAESLVGRGYVFGVDGFRFLDSAKSWVVTGRVALSRVAGEATAIEDVQLASQRYFQRPDARHVSLDPARSALSGWTGGLNLNRNSGNFQLNASLWAVSPGFESNDIGFNWKSDRWGGHAVATFKKTDPDKWTRTRSFSIAKWYALNFSGQRQGDGFHGFFNGQLLNFWNVGANGFYRIRASNDQLTRGGPNALGPRTWGAGAFVETDGRKRATLSLEVFRAENEYGGTGLESYLTLKLKPASWLQISLGPSYVRNDVIAQYVTTSEDATASATYGSRYVFGRMAQDEVAMATRINWILSPRMSLQVYAQPLISNGDYHELKELARPASYDFVRYGVDGASTLAYDQAARVYQLDPDGGGPAPAIDVDDPDFNYKSLRLNAVFRWEYRPGSTLFVVWSQGRVDEARPGEFDLQQGLRDLAAAPADDVFLVKFAYRFGR